MLWLLACTGNTTDSPTTGPVSDDTAPAVDDTGPLDPPDGDWSLSLRATPMVRLDGGAATVDVTCVALDGGVVTDEETLITGEGYDAGVLTMTAAGTVELTCEGVGLTTTTTVNAFTTVVSQGWVDAGEAHSETLAVFTTLASTGELTDDDIQTLRDHADLFARMPGWKDDSVPMVPGGYPSQDAITTAGHPLNDDDALLESALDGLDAALDEYTAAVQAFDFASGDTSDINAALDTVEQAIADAEGLEPSVGGALAQRHRLSRHLNDHLLPALHAGPAKVVEGIDNPPFFTSLVDLSVTLGIRGHLINQMYGPALDWIAVSVDTLATLELIDAAWAPDANGPDIWSVNYGKNVIFENESMTIMGEGFANQPELNQIIFVHGGLIAQALGLYSDCKDAVTAANAENRDFFDMYDKLDTCVDGVVDALNQEPTTLTGTGAMGDGDDFVGLYGPQYFSIGVHPLEYAGPWVDLVGIIPVNLSNGLRGESYNVLLYPAN